MSYGGGGEYQQYGGNPYAQNTGENGGYGTHNPYDNAVPLENAGANNLQAPPALNQETSNYSHGSNYSTATPTVLSLQDFLSKVELVNESMRKLSGNVSQIGDLHQRALANPDNSTSAQLEHLVSQTQVLNTNIKDQIKSLELDEVKTQDTTTKRTKTSQVKRLKNSFDQQLKDFRSEELAYEKRYREQIARQYRIVNPEATESEVNEAANADWGNEGVFQTALKTNRSGAANSVLGAVRARHNDIQKIERTIIELDQLFQDMAAVVELQEAPVAGMEEQTNQATVALEQGRKELDVGIKHARRRNKLKWWTLFVVVLIICILALVLGLVFGLRNK
ncbi:MAG: hypothetical protein M1819_007387 [Sarea resinae]|nr:MAG: hypothetical protein M1819_007387 [Sarea resinae]